MSQRVIAIIQARMNASRLPGKVLLDLEGATVLERVCERVNKSHMVQQVMVATTTNPDDRAIIKLCDQRGISSFCGSENDVLDRYYRAAQKVLAGHIVRITADCPLMDPLVIDKIVTAHLQTGSDYTSNTLKDTYPDGEDVEVMTFACLQKNWEQAEFNSEREHVTSYVKKHPEIFKLTSIACEEDLSENRWTMDNAEDYVFLKAVYKALFPRNPCFGMRDVLDLIKDQPRLKRINQGIIRNEGYLKSIQNDKRVPSSANPGEK